MMFIAPHIIIFFKKDVMAVANGKTPDNFSEGLKNLKYVVV